MKAGSRHILSVLACAALSGPAIATPPDIINVRDEVFGVTGDSILLLRSTHDNLGVYNAGHRDIFLVAIDRATGQETLRPVYRARIRPENSEADLPARVEGEMLPGSVNPYEILREGGGVALDASEWISGGPATMQGGNLTVAYADGAVIDVEAAALLRHVTSSLDRLAQSMADYDRLAPVTVQDLLAGQVYDPASCAFEDPVHHADPAGTSLVRLLRITCEDEGQSASLLVSVAR